MAVSCHLTWGQTWWSQRSVAFRAWFPNAPINVPVRSTSPHRHNKHRSQVSYMPSSQAQSGTCHMITVRCASCTWSYCNRQCAMHKITDHSRTATTFLQMLCSYCDIIRYKFTTQWKWIDGYRLRHSCNSIIKSLWTAILSEITFCVAARCSLDCNRRYWIA